jgi:hypothetical protein
VLVWTSWRGENSWPYRDSNSDPSIVQPVASRYTDYAILAPTYRGNYEFKLISRNCVVIDKVVIINYVMIYSRAQLIIKEILFTCYCEGE